MIFGEFALLDSSDGRAGGVKSMATGAERSLRYLRKESKLV